MSRPTLSLQRCLDHPDQCLALVGEAPGPRGNPHTPLWPDPPHMAGGRLAKMLGYSKTEYLRAFARANLLDEYPGPVFPLSVARPRAAPLAQRLAPKPLLLLGRGVAGAFRFPGQDICEWHDYDLEGTWIRAALVPHPSGRNLFYNDAGRTERVAAWLREQVEAHRAK